MQAVFNAIGQFFTDIFQFLSDLASWVLNVIKQIFVDLGEMLLDVVYYLYEQVLTLAYSLISLIPFPEVPPVWEQLPDELLNIIGLIGLAYDIGLIVAALGIRMALQLIPFTRLGS